VAEHSHAGAFDVAYVLDALLAHGLITPEQAEEARRREAVQRALVLRDKDRLGLRAGATAYTVTPIELLATLRLPSTRGHELDEDRLTEAVASHVGLPYQKIDPTKLDQKWITQTVSRPFARKHVVLPLARVGDELRVAVDNPFDVELFETLRNLTKCTVLPVLAAKSDILRLIAEIYGFRSSIQSAERDFSDGGDLGNLEQFIQLKSVDDIEATDRHVINALDFLLHYALDQRASDIHLEPKRDHGLVRLRIDGLLHGTHRIPKVVHPALITRIKTLARLDIAEKRKPQDGRFKVEHQGQEVELRVSVMATAFGEKIVMRILDRAVLLMDLEDLGFYPEEMERFRRFLAEPSGIVLVCGPTGSGKTTTLYSALQNVTRPDVNVVTIEDPVEMVLETFNQTTVMPRIDLSFANLLRTVLRQDPDVILVGEVRDPETAHQAVQAALTGHLVLTSLHTRDAAGSVARLLDLGVEPFLLSSTLLGVVAQRLVRRVCERCRTEVPLGADACAALGIPLDRADGLKVARGEGCTHCRDTGYKGRTGVFEVMSASDTLRKLVRERADATTLRRAARQDGMLTLREGAVRKLADGVTSFEEVVRVTSDLEDR
jgi:general secretion pathway protein E